jgi:hypothetical protein
MQPAKHLNRDQKLFVTLLPSTSKPLNRNSSSIIQDTFKNFTKTSFSKYACRFKIVCCFSKIFIRNKTCTCWMWKWPNNRWNCIIYSWLFCRKKSNVSSRRRIPYNLQLIMEIILCVTVHQFSSPDSIDKSVH